MAEEEQEQQLSKEEAEMRLQQMRAAVQEQMRQINILEMDAAEHRLVLEALDPLQGGRKCFRMVGTVIAIDKDGDMRIKFDDLPKNMWAFKRKYVVVPV